MYLILQIFGIFIVTAFCQEEENTLKSLEAEQRRLHQQISEAIEDSVLTLRKNQVPEAEEGIGYLNTLKQRFLNIFGTEHPNGYTFVGDNVTNDIDANNSDSKDLRRANEKYYRKTTKTDKIFDPQSLFTKIPKQKYAMMLDNRAKLETKLKEWLYKRKLEKELLKQYLEKKKRMLLGGHAEKCPRFGYGKKKKSKSLFRRKNEETLLFSNESKSAEEPKLDAVDEARRKNNKKFKYPCCRKCCKKSYLGCL